LSMKPWPSLMNMIPTAWDVPGVEEDGECPEMLQGGQQTK